MQFTKMQGIGNDYIYVNLFMEHVAHPSDLSRHISDRHFGIGSDGLVLIGPSDKADLRMQMFNADGSEGKMCGNACRCIGRYAYERGLTDRTTFTLETGSGIRTISLNVVEGKVQSAVVDMGEPIFTAEEIPTTLSNPNEDRVLVNGVTWPVTSLSMGNPHCVTFVEDPDALELSEIGPSFEHNSVYPEGVNTEFVSICPDGSLRLRVWERGSGETMACGTGACAALVAAAIHGMSPRSNVVHLRGGDLRIEWREDGHVLQEGPAEFVCDGVWPDDE
ncbi:MAG: diaminopimelate epimerase [Clostridia bacterium]|nr:diaminopimelate epimerase [Clostridia bacterium]MBQ9288819.1 diaminopimelate epimerase [Clostridia bacterium]